MIKGSYHMSRKNSDYYNRLKRDVQIDYSKSWVARLHPELLKPFIKITGATKWNREVFYEIDIERLLKVEEQNKRYRATINVMRQILKDAIHSMDVCEKVQGLEFGVKMADEALEGEECLK